ncbi:UNVERIFIED_CONTAM: hypothetical protein PYX00_005959 [Menopon gallinae]|uniref:Intraflagellar transport protein 140 homolog n=1 Tax=Menopon gallinae TaxID=328185 RepID=A0AAW2HUI4_9NEOP
MSVYFERKISTSLGDVCTDLAWFKDNKLAVALFSQEEGGYINIYNPQGNVLGKINPRNVKPVSTLSWHPQGSLFGAWDGGVLCMWSEEDNETITIESPHRASVILLVFSLHGGRLISADTAGDPTALDLFTNLDFITTWRPKTAAKQDFSYSNFRDSHVFYAAATSGVIFYVSENGRCQEVFDLGTACRDMLYRPDRDQLLILTDAIAVLQLSISPEGELDEIMKVKLSSGSKEVLSSMVMTEPGTVAINTGSSTVRLWNLDVGDNSVLGLPEGSHQSEIFSSISYSSAKGVLCGGTNAGNLVMWKRCDDEWEIETSTSAAAPVKQLVWGVELLAVNTLAHLFVLKQQPLSAHYNHKCQIAAIQTSGSNVALLVPGPEKSTLKQNISCEMQIHGVAVSNKYCVLWSDKTVVSYSFTVDPKDGISVAVVGNFSCECEKAAAYNQSLIVMEMERVSLRTMQGTVKQICFLTATEGEPIVLGYFSIFVSVATTQGFLKVWDVSMREAKQHGRTKNLKELLDDFGEVIALSPNDQGTKVAMTVALRSLIPDSKLYVVDVESDLVQWIDFATGETHVRDDETIMQDVSGKIVSSFEWDCNDPKLLVCHLKVIPTTKNDKAAYNKEDYAAMLWTSDEKGILLHEIISLTNHQTKLLACDAPHILYLSNQKADLIDRIVMGDFHGVSDINPSTNKAVLNFSYNLSVGNMDLAFKAINSVSSEAVWTNLARNCVKTKRLDVATVCMGRVKNGRVAKALREAQKEPELEAKVAILAIHVGMLDEAEQLLKSCKRYDLLNKFYQTTCDWDKAVRVAETNDRVHLRNTHHLHAKYLEQNRKIKEALESYEKADTHRIHAPRLLSEDIYKLKTYVDQSSDPVLFKWLAQYMESTGDMKSALHYYTMAKDHLSIVRVLCFLNNFNQASEVAQNTGDRAAAYHLARQFEAMERFDEALSFFIRAQAYGNAIRICKENGFTDRIWGLALSAAPREQADAARYLQEQGDIHKAILLYHKAGMVHKALDLAFSSEDSEALAIISTNLTGQTDPSLLQRVADYFLTNGQYERAVDILATAGKFSEAVALCVEHSVLLTEELAERLNPTGPERNKLLIEIGECALAQSNYHLATKKFTQAGDKVRAMKALLKSGDTDKIIFLAGVSREKEVYVMAANYLQALDWRSNPQLLNTIIQFYSKAKAYQSLSNFYVACANIEIEEYQDYEKAGVALTEAKRCLTKLSDDLITRKAVETIDRRIADVHQFLRCRRLFDSGSVEEGMSQCQKLLSQLDSATIVPPGDVYALMMENERDLNNSRKIFETMKRDVSDPAKYLSPQLLESLGYQPKSATVTQFDDDIGFEVK